MWQRLSPIWIALLALALYGRTLDFGFTRTDDVELIVDQADFLGDLRNVPAAFRERFFRWKPGSEAYYRPVMTLSLMADARWNGVEPRAFHATSVAYWVATCILLLRVLRRLGFTAPVALAAASLFTVHPALSQAVAWIPGRVDVLLALFALASLLGFLGFLETGGSRALALHAVALVLALFSKEAGVALPAVCAAWAWLDGRGAALRSGRLFSVWAGCLAAWAAAWHAATQAGAPAVVSQRLGELVAHLPVLAMHLGKLLFASPLSVLAVTADTPRLPGALALAALAAAGLPTRGRERRLLLWGALFFLAFALPALPSSGYLILESRLVLPAVGVLIAVAAIGQHGLLAGGRRRAVWLGAAAGAAGVWLFAAAQRYVGDFASPEAFSSAAVARSPRSALAQLSRGIVYQRAGDLARAELHYREAIRLDELQSMVHNNLGLVLLRTDRPEEATREFLVEIALQPGYGPAYSNLGAALFELGRLGAAEAAFRRAAELDPRNEEARAGLAALGAVRGARE